MGIKSIRRVSTLSAVMASLFFFQAASLPAHAQTDVEAESSDASDVALETAETTDSTVMAESDGMDDAAAMTDDSGTAEVTDESETSVSQNSVQQDTLVLNPDHPDTYLVKKGDTLWGISISFLRDPWLWPELWAMNEQVQNPHLIYPGDVLKLVYIDGRPTLTIAERTERAKRAAAHAADEGSTLEGRSNKRLGSTSGLDKLSPRIRVEPLDKAITSIPINAIRPFLRRPHVLSKREFEEAPYVLANFGDVEVGAANKNVYARGIDSPDIAEYMIIRMKESFRDPDSGEVLGYEGRFVSEARVERLGDPSILKLSNSGQEVRKGDRLVPLMAGYFPDSYYPHAPAKDVSGKIISLIDGASYIGQYHVVVLNMGRQDDMEEGHVLAVFSNLGELDDDIEGGSVELPPMKNGLILVFRVFERVSYALVMESSSEMRVNDVVTNP